MSQNKHTPLVEFTLKFYAFQGEKLLKTCVIKTLTMPPLLLDFMGEIWIRYDRTDLSASYFAQSPTTLEFSALSRYEDHEQFALDSMGEMAPPGYPYGPDMRGRKKSEGAA